MEVRKRDLVLGISAGISLGVAVSLVLIILFGVLYDSYEERSRGKRAEEIAEKKKEAEDAWSSPVDPDLSGYFDVMVSDYGVPPYVVCAGCRILGKATADENAGEPVGSMVRGALVLETSDGRRVYAKDSVVSLEESVQQ